MDFGSETIRCEAFTQKKAPYAAKHGQLQDTASLDERASKVLTPGNAVV